MAKKIIITIIIAILCAASFFVYPMIPNALIVHDLKQAVIPLKTVKAGNGFDDMAALEGILKDKKIVAMGEATHGTSEFFLMKHRMFEFLVEKMGYRVFAIEAPFGDCKAANDYILTGKGSSLDAARDMRFWTWSNAEVADMIAWMKEYNENPEHKTKIKFYGFDMQDSDKCKDEVLGYIEKYDSGAVEKYKEVFSQFKDYDFRTNEFHNQEQIKEAVDGLLKSFEENKVKYIAQSSEGDYEMQHQNINIIRQCIEYYSKSEGIAVDMMAGNAATSELRDKYMAENVKWIMEYESRVGNDKVMLWAHNIHVSKGGGFVSYTTMGENLYRDFKDKLYVIGFDFYEGSFRAIDDSQRIAPMKNFTLVPPDKDSFAYTFEKAGIPIFFLDTKEAAEKSHLYKYISVRHMIHCVGSSYRATMSNEAMHTLNITKAFDGIIFIKNSTPSHYI